MISLNKKTGINLKKGSSIRLEKNGIPLNNVCIGLNWGAIERKPKIFDIFFGSKTVDLDGSVALFAGSESVDTVYYKKLISSDGSIRHSGDDLTGDMNGDDGLDNEVIVNRLSKVSSKITQIVFFLNSYKKQNFADIPYSKIRIYEGTPIKVKEVLATFNLSADPNYAKNISMVMAKLVRQPDNSWKFVAIGEPVKAKTVRETVAEIQQRFL